MELSTSNLDEVEPSDGGYNPELFDTDSDDYDDPSWFELVKAEIETMENFKVIFDNPWGVMRVFHYGTEIGCCYHYGSHLDIETRLIRELDKYDVDLELFLFNHRINFKYVIPSEPKTFRIEWEDEIDPVKGTIDGHFFRFLHNSYHGDYLQVIHKNRLYHSYWQNLPEYIHQYFGIIWRDIFIKEFYPLEPSIGSVVATFLPLGYRAYCDSKYWRYSNQCKVAKGSKHCYITKWRDCDWDVSFSSTPTLAPTTKCHSLYEAIDAAIAMIEN